MTARFVADVGGTNIRLAQEVDGKLHNIRKYRCEDFPTIDAAIQHYFSECEDPDFEAGCIAIACPVSGDWIKMTNHSWAFSVEALQKTLGLKWLAVINDFASVAFSLPGLSSDQKIQIGGKDPVEHANIAVFGPGTGLGVEHLTHTVSGWKALDGEGGHVNFSPQDDTDMIIWQYLQNKHGHASAEEVLSGRGIVQIYEALASHEGESVLWSDPADITQRALSGECRLCEATLQQFCRIMGTFAGDLALNLATRGGVYIGGGIVARFIDFLQQSDFRRRFEQKWRFAFYVEPIPVYIITEPDHGLLGAAAYLEQQFNG